MSEERKDKDKEIILIKPYEVLTTTSKTTELSFIQDKIKNLERHMKFVCSPTQTRLFKPSLHYQSLPSRGKQNPEFWKEVATASMEEKHNIETSRNGYPITIYQGGPLYEPYFIAIYNQGQVIISPDKKIVATHVIGELEILV